MKRTKSTVWRPCLSKPGDRRDTDLVNVRVVHAPGLLLSLELLIDSHLTFVSTERIVEVELEAHSQEGGVFRQRLGELLHVLRTVPRQPLRTYI